MPVKIKDVNKDSHAFKAGIMPGFVLNKINGSEIFDVLDFRFHQTSSHVLLDLTDTSGSDIQITIKKREYDDLGLMFETYLMDEQRSCKNKCVFCFIDQLPAGLRESLYFKDDDSRLSFLFGNYITLTNITEHEINRIINMHISPVNVSVHTTDPELRVKMMGNRFAGDALNVLKRFSSAGISLGCQVVCCRGINDGEALTRTLNDLSELASIQSVAIVPVGLTKYRQGLYPLEAFDQQSAFEVIEIIDQAGNESLKTNGRRIFYAADEFYLKARLPLPDADYYGDFDQLENGIGLMALLKQELLENLADRSYNLNKHRIITVATGIAAAPLISELTKAVSDIYGMLKVNVVAVNNDFFGSGIDVAGLITGQDIINCLKGRELGDELLIPAVMLNGDGLFLDSLTPYDVEKALGIKLTPVKNDGAELLKCLLGVKSINV